MGVLGRCPDGFLVVVLAGRRHWGWEGRGGTMRFARCGCPGRCWPRAAKQWRGGTTPRPSFSSSPCGRRSSSGGCACNDRVVVPQVRAPFDTTPRCDGGNRARVQGILLRQERGERGLCGLGGVVRLCLPPCNGVRLAGSAPSRFGARGGRRGRSLGVGAGEQQQGKQ